MGYVVLVTGASSGIGKESVKEFLNKGYIVYGAARRVEKMDDLKELGAFTLKMDVTNEESVKSALDLVQKNHGSIDILVNNAGYGSYGSVEEVDLKEAKRQFDVNLFGLARLIQLVLPGMRDKKSGRIINISSVGGKIYSPFGAWYHATKHALEGFSDCLRLELKAHNIDVVLIQPGLIKTEWDEIANEGLVKTSGAGPYKELVDRVVNGITSYYTKSGSHPSVVARKILKAAVVKRPKTRYSVGKFAFTFLTLRKILTDKQFDSLNYAMV